MRVLFWMFIGFDRHATSEHLLEAVIDELCQAGHSVHIIQKDTGGDLPHIPESLSHYSITTDVIPYKSANKNNFFSRYITELKYIRACKKYIKQSGVDAVFVQSTTVAGFAVKMIRKLLSNAILTINVQDIFPYNASFSGKIRKNGLIFRVLSSVQRFGYKNADNIITISEDMKETLVNDGVSPDKIEVIYNWSYQDEPYNCKDYSSVSSILDSNVFNVVYAGNIGVMQNVGVLVEVARRMSEDHSVHFHVIGDGVKKEGLVAKSKEYGLDNMSFWSMLPSDLAPTLYSAASVNFIPLIKDGYRTAFPSKTATCLACNKPILFAIGKDSIIGSSIESLTGCPVCESDDVTAIIDSIKKIKNGEISINTVEFFLAHCLRKKNANQYAAVITTK